MRISTVATQNFSRSRNHLHDVVQTTPAVFGHVPPGSSRNLCEPHFFFQLTSHSAIHLSRYMHHILYPPDQPSLSRVTKEGWPRPSRGGVTVPGWAGGYSTANQVPVACVPRELVLFSLRSTFWLCRIIASTLLSPCPPSLPYSAGSSPASEY